MNHVFVLAGNGEVRHYTGGYADYRADVAEQERIKKAVRCIGLQWRKARRKEPAGETEVFL